MTKIQYILALALLTLWLAGCESFMKKPAPAPEPEPEPAVAQIVEPDQTDMNVSKMGSKTPTEIPAAPVIESEAELDNEVIHRPFIVASESAGTLAEATAATLSSLEAAGFQVAGQYSPLEDTNIIVVTNDELKRIAAMTVRGGYAAGQRVSVTETDGNVEVGFTNPVYIQYAYHLKGDMQPVYDGLTGALGMLRACGGGKKKMTARKLDSYRYMMGMQHFDDVSELGSFDSNADAIAAVESGLAKPDGPLTQVYRIDIPGTTQTVYGVGMKLSNVDNKALDEAYQMSVVDFEGCKKRAYFPYEVLVRGKDVEALHMRFRMAVHFPNLSMMGSHGFTKLVSSPRVIEDALEDMLK